MDSFISSCLFFFFFIVSVPTKRNKIGYLKVCGTSSMTYNQTKWKTIFSNQWETISQNKTNNSNKQFITIDVVDFEFRSISVLVLKSEWCAVSNFYSCFCISSSIEVNEVGVSNVFGWLRFSILFQFKLHCGQNLFAMTRKWWQSVAFFCCWNFAIKCKHLEIFKLLHWSNIQIVINHTFNWWIVILATCLLISWK